MNAQSRPCSHSIRSSRSLGAYQEDDFYTHNVPVCEILSSYRHAYRLSLADVEAALNIRASMIDSIERGAYGEIPGQTYVIGFMRAYAEYLGLDAQRLVGAYKSQSGVNSMIKNPRPIENVANDNNMPKRWLVLASAVLFTLFALFGASLYFPQSQASSVLPVPDQSAAAQNVQRLSFENNDGTARVNALNPLPQANLYY